MFYSITRFGHESVLIFFVLSGFLVGGRTIEKISNGEFVLRDYAIDRFARIMLPLLASLLLYIPVSVFCDIPIKPMIWIGNLLSLQGIVTDTLFGTLWSLSYEVWFYVLIGAAAVMFTFRNSKGRLYGSATLLLCLFVFSKLNSLFLFVWLVGAFCYWVMPKQKNWLLCLSLCAFASFMLLAQNQKTLHLSWGHITEDIMFRYI